MVVPNIHNDVPEKSDKFRNKKAGFFKFLTSAIAVVAGTTILVLFSYISLFILPIIQLIIPLNLVSASLLILFLAQILGAIIVYYVFLPMFKLQKDKFKSISGSNLRRMALLIFVGHSLYMLSSLALVFFFNSFDLTPKTGYGSILPDKQHLTDPLTLILYFTSPTIGAGVFEELVYRRMVIPLFERNGLSSFMAVLISALLFAISHLPNDILNGNLPGGIIHTWGVFIIGIVVGIMYIFSRRVIFSMIMHAIFNLISFMGYIVILINDPTVVIINATINFTLIGVGVAFFIYILIIYSRKPSSQWVEKLKEKSSFNPKLGIIGFLMIGTMFTVILILFELSLPLLMKTGLSIEIGLLIYVSICVTIIITLLWIGNRRSLIHLQKNK